MSLGEAKETRAAGVGCYSLYLVHVPLLWAFHANPKGALVPVYWALTGALSLATYRFIEKPGMVRGKRTPR